MNFDAGRVRSMTGPSAVKVRTPVAISARSVDWSAWVRSGVCPGGLPEAAPQTQPSMIGWMVAEAADALLRMSAAATNIARTKRLMVTPLRERDTQPHPAMRPLYISRLALVQNTPNFNAEIPTKIMTPDRVSSRLGTLEFFDGMPSDARAATVLDHLTFLRGVEVFLSTIPAASLEALRSGLVGVGATASNIVVISTDSRPARPSRRRSAMFRSPRLTWPNCSRSHSTKRLRCGTTS